VSDLDRFELIVSRLPEVGRVDEEARGGEPTIRVAGKNFVFAGRGQHDHAQSDEEWIRTSYALVAPKSLARQILEEDETTG
jgi:hypothetical protein